MYLLYRAGNKHTVWGKECEYKQFHDEDVDNALQNGWYLHPKDIREEKEINPTFESIDTNDSGKLSNKEVREAAKLEGVEGWETKQINTLKKELGV